jgi:hypothetical protein
MFTKSRIDGYFGFIIIPDQDTMVKACELAKELAPQAAMRVDRAFVPLHSTPINQGSVAFIDYALKGMQELLHGAELTFTMVETFGGRCLHWYGEINPTMKLVHLSSLVLNTWRDPEKPAVREEEKLKLSDTEKRNAEVLGNPLSGAHYRHYIRLASDEAGLSSKSLTKSHIGYVKDVKFALLGPWDRVEQIML